MNNQSPQPQAVMEMHGVSGASMRDLNSIVVEQVDWTVRAGDFWVVGGMQGAGKSDLLMMAAGLMAPVAGSYFCFGEEMPIFEDARLPQRLKLGLVFDGGQLFNHLTIAENVALPLRYHQNLTRPDAAAEVQWMLELTDLAPWADSTPGAIGRNWQKRVGLARALMMRPELLFIDNPFAGLDLRHRIWWLGFLETLAKGPAWMNGRPLTIIATGDDFRPWRSLARQYGILKDKRLLLFNSWKDVESSTDELVHDLLSTGQQSF